MNVEIIIAMMTAAGTVIGAFMGVLATAKLTQYRLNVLEEKVSEQAGLHEQIVISRNLTELMSTRVDSLEKESRRLKDILESMGKSCY